MADAAVAALVGSRCEPNRPPQSATWPLLTYSLVSQVNDATNDGAAGPLDARVQVDVWAYTYLEMEAIAEAVIAALHGQTWRTSSVAYATAFHAGERDLPETQQVKGEGERRIERRSIDFRVVFRAAS